MSADLGAIKRKLGPRKRHVNLNIQAAKEVKQRPIEGDLDLEQLLDDTREKRDQLQQYLTVYKSLRAQLEETAQSIGKREYDKVMEDYDDYADLTLEAEQLVVGLSSRMEMIKDRMEFKLRRGTLDARGLLARQRWGASERVVFVGERPLAQAVKSFERADPITLPVISPESRFDPGNLIGRLEKRFLQGLLLVKCATILVKPVLQSFP